MAKVKKSEIKKQEKYIEELVLDDGGTRLSDEEKDIKAIKLMTELIRNNVVKRGKREEVFEYEIDVLDGLIHEAVRRIEARGKIDPVDFRNLLGDLISSLNDENSYVNTKNRAFRKRAKTLSKYLANKVNFTRDYTGMVSYLDTFILENRDETLFDLLKDDDYTVFNKKDKHGDNFITKVVYRYIDAINDYFSNNQKYKDTVDITYLDGILSKLKPNLALLDLDSKDRIFTKIQKEKEKITAFGLEERLDFIDIVEKRLAGGGNFKLNTVDHMKIHNLCLPRKTRVDHNEIITSRRQPYANLSPRKIYTIDGNTSSVKDDAISCKMLMDRYQVGIHIVDPLAYLFKENDSKSILEGSSPQSDLIECILHQTETIYHPKDEMSLFPEEFLEIITPLEKDKLTHVNSFYFEIDKEGNILNKSFKKEDILVTENLSYQDIDTVLKDKEHPSHGDISLINMASNAIASGNAKAQKYMDNKKPGVQIMKAERLVENMMLLCNSGVANYFKENKLPYIYRNHRNENRNYTHKKFEFINSLKAGLQPEYTEEVQSRKIPKYSDQCLGHEGLDIPAYGHITSPLRRSADLINSIALNSFYYKDVNQVEVEFMNNFNKDISAYINNQKAVIRSHYEKIKSLKDVNILGKCLK